MDTGRLEGSIAGSIVRRGDNNYDATRRAMVWNQLKPERCPEVIVHVASDTDVVAAVQFARAHRLRIAVRGGGHSWCGVALRDGGMLIDLSRLQAVSVDAAACVAAVQPVVTSRDLARQLGAHGLAFPLGHCSTVPLSGYLLNGGFGWNAGVWGPACFSIRGIDVVTADGRLRAVTAENDADVLWAARGAGPGFFGVVTRYHLQLYTLPRAITTSTYVYPFERLTEIADWLAALRTQLSPSVELVLTLTGAQVPTHTGSSNGVVCTVSATAFVDSPDAARAALAPFERSPLVAECLHRDTDRETPFEVLFDDMDRLFPERHRYLADTLWSNAPAAHVLGALGDHLPAAPSRKSLVLCVVPPPPPAGAPAAPDAAFSMAGGVMVLCYAVWDDPKDDAANHAWHRQAMELLEPFATGHYVGESDIVATPSRAARSFAPANWERLSVLRKQYDPHGLFHGFFDGEG